MRKLFIAGNWKMNKGPKQAKEFAQELKERLKGVTGIELGVCPPAISIVPVAEVLEGSNIKVGAQNVYIKESGAFTGEISAPMVKEAGAEFVICGHSERRHILGENDEFINNKVKAVLSAGLKVILCVGELLEEREAGKTNAVIETQVKAGLNGLSLIHI